MDLTETAQPGVFARRTSSRALGWGADCPPPPVPSRAVGPSVALLCLWHWAIQVRHRLPGRGNSMYFIGLALTLMMHVKKDLSSDNAITAEISDH